MGKTATLLEALGGEEGCRQFSTAFYARVKEDPELHRLFPGKSLRCATEEFAAFLIQFLDGDEAQTQKRWWLSLHESHARFQIGPNERGAWLKQMRATLDALPLEGETRQGLKQFFLQSSAYLVDKPASPPAHHELSARWDEQRDLDDAISAIAAQRDEEAINLSQRFVARPSVFVGLLVRMMQTHRETLVAFVCSTLENDPSLIEHRFAGKTVLHYAAGAGRLDAVTLLLQLGMDPNTLDHGGHTPLYSVANECATTAGPTIVRALVQAGVDVNRHEGVTQATALHMAARRGHLEIARTLLDAGADSEAKDRKGETPLQRAIHCRKHAVAALLKECEAATAAP